MLKHGPVFGEIPGIATGQRFRRREDLRTAGVHRQPGRGIDATREGAVAVVFAGGYVDDAWTEQEAWYTGEGGQDQRGRQVHDQQMSRGNSALKRNLDTGQPVRVIRRVDKDDDFEYVYEGLYGVVDLRYEPGKDGPKIFRFLLRKENSQRTPTS
jgi:hypothetical protein